jgi:ATP-dependent helicase HepA
LFGRFVRIENSDTGVGKLASFDGMCTTVEYFDGPNEDPIVVTAPTSSVVLVEIAPQTRVYWLDRFAGFWRVGRVLDGEGDRFAVRFPNGDERVLPTHELYIRWSRPIADPAPFLAHWINETPLFADARSGFVQALVEQRAACQGMSALLSAVIDLEGHQIEVVRRVLQDPVQRYLLADEVGLGKTIEAGVLIRQYALDDPESHQVLVLVPDPLVAQWRDELRRRFLLEIDDGERIRVLPTSDRAAIAPALARTGMLVVDEAHHLSRDPALYDLLRQTAATVPRLLLLSATPVLRNERGFLDMLHLLDPVVFPLDGEEAFGRKIAHRQSLAESVAGLIPENLLHIEDFLDDLVARFSDDPLLMGRVAALREVVGEFPQEDDPRFLEALSEVRAHLSEVYRLDRRILRNRRAGVPGLTPNRAGATFVDYRSPTSASFARALESWRGQVALRLYGREGGEDARHTAVWFADLLNAALSDHPALVAGLQRAVRSSARTPEAKALADLLSAAHALLSDEARIVCLLDTLVQVGENSKCVVFCSSPDTADRVVGFLRARLDQPVERPDRGVGADADPALRRFMEEPGHRILVCDAQDEEGLNLQGGAKALIHFDLPLAPNRIEQRIGRLDRYGAGDAIRSFVLRCLDDPLEQAWAACLSEGLAVFSRSIASLQYMMDAEMQELRVALLTESK